MNKTSLLSILFAVSILLAASACSSTPSEDAVQTAIAQTQAAPSTGSSTPTDDPAPTATAKPRVSCPDDEANLYLEELALLLEEFDDTAELAGSTSRMGLAPVIQSLQSLKRDARRLERPECANYLNDLVIVAMETETDAFISFLAQDSDTVVARKLAAAEEVRSTVDSEISAFRADPVAAYEASELTAESLAAEAEQTEPFTLPSGWIDIEFPDSDELILSVPENWTQGTWGDEDQYLALANDDQTLTVLIDVFEESSYTEFDSDRVRLFSLQTALETQDWDFYLEHSAETGLYARNRGYVVEFSRRYSKSGDIEDSVWAIIVTPDEHEVFVITSTDRDEFAQIDLLTVQEIYGSIRAVE